MTCRKGQSFYQLIKIFSGLRVEWEQFEPYQSVAPLFNSFIQDKVSLRRLTVPYLECYNHNGMSRRFPTVNTNRVDNVFVKLVEVK